MHSKQTTLSRAARLSGSFRRTVAIASLSLLLMPLVSVVAASIGLANGWVEAANVPTQDNQSAAQADAGAAAAAAKPATCQAAGAAEDPKNPGLPPCLEPQKNDVSSCPKGDCIFTTYINPAIKTVSALVGIGVTISIIVGGIQYASSADSPQKVSAAKTRIVKSIFILLAYFFFLAFLNWVIPGGINATGAAGP